MASFFCAYLVLILAFSLDRVASEEWTEVTGSSDLNTYQVTLRQSSLRDDWDQVFSCGSFPYEVVSLYKRGNIFVGSVKCNVGTIWVRTLTSSKVSVKVNPPLDLFVVPTTPIPPTTNTIPLTTAPTAMQTTDVVTTAVETNPPTTPSVDTKRTTNEKPSTVAKVIRPATNPDKQTRTVNTVAKKEDEGGSYSISKTNPTVSPFTKQPPNALRLLSNKDKFLLWLGKSNPAMRDACSNWTVLSNYDSKLNSTAIRTTVRVKCSDVVFPVSLKCAFDKDISQVQSGVPPLLVFCNETVLSNASWVESKYNYELWTLPDSMVDIVNQKCSAGFDVSISTLTNKQIQSYDFTRVVCSQTVNTTLFLKSFTPDESEPVFVNLYSKIPYYVEEVYKSGFSVYRTVKSKEGMQQVSADIKKMDQVASELAKLSCSFSNYDIKAAHSDPTVASTSYFVELVCNEKIYYLEYEKPDYPQTRITLESMDVVPSEVANAQMLPHSGWVQKWNKFDSEGLLKRTVNFAAALKDVGCKDYSILLTYERLVAKDRRKFYLVVLFCSSKEADVSVMYANIATVSDAEWFQPVLTDRLRSYPPRGF